MLGDTFFLQYGLPWRGDVDVFQAKVRKFADFAHYLVRYRTDNDDVTRYLYGRQDL